MFAQKMKMKTKAAAAAETTTNHWACRSCGKNRVKTWCLNTKCKEYVGPLHLCGVSGCDISTPKPHVLCRVHWNKGAHCGTCARKVNEEGHCLKCDDLLNCCIPECQGHAKYVNERTIPLCTEHFGTRICFEHVCPLMNGICPQCPEAVACAVEECKNPTVDGRPLCVAHHKEGYHCACGKEFSGLDQATVFCARCDEHWRCATKGCSTYIGAYKYCKTCYSDRTEYLA
jgi:hypothetical protein